MRSSRPGLCFCLSLVASACGPKTTNEATDGPGTSLATDDVPPATPGTTGDCPTRCGDTTLSTTSSCGDGEPCDPPTTGDGCDTACPVVPFELLFPGVMPRAVAVAPDGWIVTGGSQTTPTIAPWFARISVSGEAVWTETPADADIGSSVQALVVDDDGLIHAAGGTTYDDSSGAAWFARLDASGATHDAASFVIGDYTRAEGVALGPGPAWYVGGEAGTYSAWVRRLDAAATVAWTWQEPDASAFALAVDPAGDAFAAGVVYGGQGAVWKIDAAGQTVWKREQPTPWLELAVDASGALYVGGSETTATGLDLWVAKLAPDGAELWRETFAQIAGASPSDTAGALALAPDGTLFFATQALWQGSQLHAFAPDDGASTWSAPPELRWRWESVAVLSSGDPVVVGWDEAGPTATGIVRAYDLP